MFTDAARAASIAVRSGGGGGGGGNVAAQGAAIQSSFRAAAGASPYRSRQVGGKAPGGGVAAKGGGRVGRGASQAQASTPAHGKGVAAVARSMNGSGSQLDTRQDKTRLDQLRASSAPRGGGETTQTDRNTMDNINTRYANNATMVGDHTTPQALQKYLD